MKCCEVSNPAFSLSGASATLPAPGIWKVEGGTLSTLFGITYYPIAGMARLDILPVTLQIEYNRGCFDLRILLP